MDDIGSGLMGMTCVVAGNLSSSVGSISVCGVISRFGIGFFISGCR